MKHLIAALTTFALLGFALPAFACDGSKKATADTDEATMTSTETADGDHACTSDCDHADEKKAKAETDKAEGEV